MVVDSNGRHIVGVPDEEVLIAVSGFHGNDDRVRSVDDNVVTSTTGRARMPDHNMPEGKDISQAGSLRPFREGHKPEAAGVEGRFQARTPNSE